MENGSGGQGKGLSGRGTRPVRGVATCIVLCGGLAAGGLPASGEAEMVAGGEAALSPVTVQAGRAEQRLAESPAAVSAIDHERIVERNPRNLDDLFQGLPGVETVGGPRPEAINPNIRGLGDGRVVVRLDGARQNFLLNHRGQVFLDPALLEEGEVLRGPASTLYGSGAIGGVANFRTLDPDAFLGSRERRGRLRSGVEDNGNARFGTATAGQRWEQSASLASISRRRSDDFEDGDGERVPYTRSDSVSGLLRHTYTPSDAHRWTFGYLGFRDEGESLNTADRPQGDEVERRIRQNTVTARYEGGGSPSIPVKVDATAYATEVDLRERLAEGAREDVNELTTTGLDAAFTTSYDAFGLEHAALWGTEVYRDRQRGTRNGAPRERFAGARQTVAGLFAQNRVHLSPRLAATAGARYDHVEQRADRDGTDNNKLSELSPQGSISYRLTEALTWHVSYAESFRAPGLAELYVGGEHFPGNDYVPNPDLRPEQAENWETALHFQRRDVRRRGDRVEGRITAYRNRVSNFIEQVVTEDATRFENVAEAEIRGVELEGTYRTPGYELSVSGARLRGDDTNEGVPLESIAPDKLTVEGVVLGAHPQLKVGARVSAVAAQRRVPEGPHTRDATDGHTVADLFATWYTSDRLELHFGVDNVTNRTYRRHLAELNDRGRTFRLAASMSL